MNKRIHEWLNKTDPEGVTRGDCICMYVLYAAFLIPFTMAMATIGTVAR